MPIKGYLVLLVGVVLAIFSLYWLVIWLISTVQDGFDFGSLLLLALLSGVPGFIGFGILSEPFSEKKKAKNDAIKRNNAKMNDYNEKLAHYALRMNEVNQHNIAVNAMISIIDSNLKKIIEDRDMTQKYLDELYSKQVLFPKYQYFIAVCTIYEYFLSGRCSTLEGHEGAYNMYELESRLDIIITKLDSILSNLDKIKQNQYVLYSAISETNNELSRINNSISMSNHQLDTLASEINNMNSMGAITNDQLSRIACNQEIANYNLEQVRKAQEMHNRALGLYN